MYQVVLDEIEQKLVVIGLDLGMEIAVLEANP